MQLDALHELGLSDGQIQVYRAILGIGASSLNAIHEKTGIERRNIYDILNKLIERGLVAYTSENGKRTYQATHPNKVLTEIQQKQKQLKVLEETVPSLISLYNESKQPIRAEVYRGNEAMRALLEEVLEHPESRWIGGNSGVEKHGMKIWFKHWMQRRIEKKHVMYDLVDYGTWLEGLEPNETKKHAAQYYHYQTLPEKLASPMVIIIFGNKVAQILWSEQSFAFVIESKEITQSYLKYFNYFWPKKA